MKAFSLFLKIKKINKKSTIGPKIQKIWIREAFLVFSLEKNIKSIHVKEGKSPINGAHLNKQSIISIIKSSLLDPKTQTMTQFNSQKQNKKHSSLKIKIKNIGRCLIPIKKVNNSHGRIKHPKIQKFNLFSKITKIFEKIFVDTQ
jgi:hypothetical protein